MTRGRTPAGRFRYAATALLLAVGASVARAGDPGLVTEARDGVRDVFTRPEFAPLLAKDVIDLPHLELPELSWMEMLVRWATDVLKAVFGAIGKVLGWIANAVGNLIKAFRGISGPEGAIVPLYLGWIVAGIALALLVWILLRHRAGSRRRDAGAVVGAGLDAGGVDDALAKSPEAWRREAAELAGGGRRRESLRALYLALLAELHRMGAIDYDRSRTNTAYVTDLSTRHEAHEPFRRLTLRFDRVWYGGIVIEAPELTRSEHDADSVRAAFVAEGRRVP